LGKVIHIDSQGSGGGSGTGYIGVFDNYTALITAFPTAPTLSLAYVQNSQGTPWLPGSLLGTFYSKGTYLFDGVNWVDGLDEVSEELQNILDTMNSQNLAEVLIEGNVTGANDIVTSNDQSIVAANGGGSFELRANSLDGSVETLGDSVYQQAGQFGSSDVGYLGINTLTVFFGLFKQNFTKSGQIQLTNNDTTAATVLNLPQYVFMASVQNGRIEIGVVNSGIGSGLNTIGKTDNTWYSSQIGYNSGEDGELIVKNTPSATDRTQTHQDDDGIIALTKNIPKAFFAVNLDSAESSVARVFAGGRTTFTITHNIGTLDLKPEVFRLSDGRTIGWRVERTGINTVEASRTGNVADGLFRILI